MVSIARPEEGLETPPAAVAVRVDDPDAGGSDSYVVDFRGLKGSPAPKEQQSQFLGSETHFWPRASRIHEL